ncbi:MAG: N-formylglutamate amidohydrolase [Planctomyces sp.]|nr:N-formylglutamate amidohydrolase [Planctomyces sp.]
MKRLECVTRRTLEVTACSAAIVFQLLLACVLACPVKGQEEYLRIQRGELPIVISAPHGGTKLVPEVPERKGEGLPTGSSGFFTGRDGGTEELALEVAKQLEQRMNGKPWYVISQVHRKYVDFNRPAEIAVEHERTRVIYDAYHSALKEACRTVRQTNDFGLLVDIHGQGSSSVTVYRGTKNGLTVTRLREHFSEEAHSGPNSFFGLLKNEGWTVFPDPLEGKEQAGFTGGYIVQTYGSHRGNGLEAIQLEFGSRYRTESARVRTAEQLVNVIVQWKSLYKAAGTSNKPSAPK